MSNHEARKLKPRGENETKSKAFGRGTNSRMAQSIPREFSLLGKESWKPYRLFTPHLCLDWGFRKGSKLGVLWSGCSFHVISFLPYAEHTVLKSHEPNFPLICSQTSLWSIRNGSGAYLRSLRAACRNLEWFDAVFRESRGLLRSRPYCSQIETILFNASKETSRIIM